MTTKEYNALKKNLEEQRKLVSSSKEAATALLTELGLLKKPRAKSHGRKAA